MARNSFDVALAPAELRARLRQTFETQEELIRKRLPAACRGAFEGEDRFWIQVPDPHRSNQWNEAVRAARPVSCAFAAAGDGSRVLVEAKRKRGSLGVIALCALVAAAALSVILWVGGIFGRQGYVPGMRTTMAWSVGALACALLGMLGAILWGGARRPT